MNFALQISTFADADAVAFAFMTEQILYEGNKFQIILESPSTAFVTRYVDSWNFNDNPGPFW